MHAQLAGRGHDRLAQDFETPELFQREAEIDFFAGEILLIEAAGFFEGIAAGEKESARAQPEREIERAEKARQKDGSPKSRQLPIATRAPPPTQPCGEGLEARR